MEILFATNTPNSDEIEKKFKALFSKNSANGIYKSLIASANSIASEFALLPDLQIVIGVIQKDTAYLYIYGKASVKITREGVISILLAGKEAESSNASGFIKPGDALFFVTDKTTKKFEKENWFKKILSSRPKIRIKPRFDYAANPESKKTTFFVGILLLVMLFVSVGFGIRQKNLKEKAAVEDRKNQEAAALEASGHYNANTDLFLDLSLLSAGFKGDNLSFSGGNIFILDKTTKRIVSVEIETKKSKVVAGAGKLEEVFDLASYEDRVFVLDSNGVGEVGDEVKNVIEKGWDDQALIHAFAGNMYVLDKKTNLIYRYAGDDDTFGSKQNWLSSSTKPDLSGSKSWTFDGAIYILTNSGKVLKFSQGSPQNFSIPSEVLSVDAIFGSDENEFLYILDKTGKKVVVVEKNGKFKAQYSSDKIGEATDLIASETEKKIILLAGEKLLVIDMK